MYEDMMIQELNEDQLEQVVGGSTSIEDSVENALRLTNINLNANINVNVATGSSIHSAGESVSISVSL